MKKRSKTGAAMRRLESNCDEVCALLKALSHPGRLLILGHLVAGEKTVSELQELCGISQSQLSQFLARMRHERLVLGDRRGRSIVYRTADDRVAWLIRAIQALYSS